MKIFALIFALALMAGCSTTSVSTTAYKTEATTDAAVTAAMSGWGAYVAAYHPAVSEELQVQSAFNKYQQAELAAIDATTAFSAATSTNSASSTTNEVAALTAATQSLTDVLNLVQSFETNTNK
jgi:hypothetical protein